jgi:hypothetical protein
MDIVFKESLEGPRRLRCRRDGKETWGTYGTLKQMKGDDEE